MLMIMLTYFIFFFVSLVLFSLSMLISKKTNNWREKFSPFECGFDFFNYSRNPFSMQFFLIAIIFIIFDIEIALILPLIPTIFMSNISKWILTMIIFFVILILGTLLEWKENSFEWKL